MFWQISSLLFKSWRNRGARLLERYPAAWALVLVLPLIYTAGAYLSHMAVYATLRQVAGAALGHPGLEAAVAFSLSSSFGLTAFLLIMFATILSPDETLVSRALGPLPVSALHKRVGMMLPGLAFLFIALVGLWVPILAAFVRTGFRSPAQVALAFLLGFLCYGAGSLMLYQATFYLVRRIFGADRVGLRSTALPVCILIGLAALTASMALGGSSFLRAATPVWLFIVPGYWMSLVLSHSWVDVLVGVGVLMSVTLAFGAAYLRLVERTDPLTTGSHGTWVPLRRLPMGRTQVQACVAYEWKSASRDQQLVLGLFLAAGTFVVAIGAVAWLRYQHDPLWPGLILLATTYLGTVLLCAAAQMSWGRDSEQRRVLAITPLNPRDLVLSKLLANLLAIGAIWLLLTGLLVTVGGQPQALRDEAAIVPLAVVIAFCFGVAVPYSPNDPVTAVTATGTFVLFGVPLQLLAQQAFGLVQARLLMPPAVVAALMDVSYIALLGACLTTIVRLDRARLQRDRG